MTCVGGYGHYPLNFYAFSPIYTNTDTILSTNETEDSAPKLLNVS